MPAPSPLPQPSAVDRARELLAGQRAGLEAALVYWGERWGNPYVRQQYGACAAHFNRVKFAESEMSRAPDFFAPLILGELGPNGRGPLLDMLIAEAAREANPVAARVEGRRTA